MRGESLPHNWQPTCDDKDYGRRLGLNQQQIEDIAEDMRLWAAANAHRQIGRKADWSAAFKGWMRRDARKLVRQNQRPSQRAAQLADQARQLEFDRGLTETPPTVRSH